MSDFDPTTGKPMPLPIPQPEQPDILATMILFNLKSPAAIRIARHRRAYGIATYGTPLQPHNGRDAIKDLSFELCDAAAYAKQGMLEGTIDESFVRRVLALYEDAANMMAEEEQDAG